MTLDATTRERLDAAKERRKLGTLRNVDPNSIYVACDYAIMHEGDDPAVMLYTRGSRRIAFPKPATDRRVNFTTWGWGYFVYATDEQVGALGKMLPAKRTQTPAGPGRTVARWVFPLPALIRVCECLQIDMAKYVRAVPTSEVYDG
jgi:hypothetical protein